MKESAMTNYIKSTIAFIAQGLGDSIAGTFKVYHLDKLDREDGHRKDTQEKEEPLSTLARRRAERLKHKPAKVDR